jgi:hypothetical protein
MQDILGSSMPADNSYGRNGFQGASSDTPGKRTTSGVLPQVVLPKDDWQTRGVDTLGKGAKPGTTFGHRSRNGE